MKYLTTANDKIKKYQEELKELKFSDKKFLLSQITSDIIYQVTSLFPCDDKNNYNIEVKTKYSKDEFNFALLFNDIREEINIMIRNIDKFNEIFAYHYNDNSRYSFFKKTINFYEFLFGIIEGFECFLTDYENRFSGNDEIENTFEFFERNSNASN